MKINNLDNPFFIILLCLLSFLVNILSSVYFFPILFLGILYMAFFVCMKKRYHYSLMLVVLTILFIEINNGFKAFSITLLATFMYIFIAPFIKRTLSFATLNPYINIAVFYLSIYILWLINNEMSTQLNYIILINLLIDFIIFGVFI